MKKEKKKTNKVGKLSEKGMMMLVECLAQNGDRFGNDIIEMMDLKAINPIKLGAVTIGLSKAWAMVKDLGRRTGIDVETLYRKEMTSFYREFEKMNK